MSLAESLERAAEALPADAGRIRPANGDPIQLLALLDGPAAGRVLCWLLADRPDDGAELAAAWLDEPAGAEALGRVSQSELPKGARKALRRVLHRARSQGLEIAGGTDETRSRVARLPSLNDPVEAGYVSPYDPRGGRLVYLVTPNPAGGSRVFEALLDEERGVVDFKVYSSGRTQVRQFIREVTRREQYSAVEVEPALVRALIARRAARHPSTRSLPRSFSEWRGRLLEQSSEGVTPGEQVRKELGDEASPAAIEELAARVTNYEIGPWPPGAERLEQATAELRRRLAPDGGAGGSEPPEPVEPLIRETLESLYRAEAGVAAAERFEETAFLMWRRGQEDAARACLATASAFRGGDWAGSAVACAMIGILQQALFEQLRGESEKASDTGDA